MRVYQIRLKIFLLQSIPYNRMQSTITKYIDCVIAKKEEFLQLHNENAYKYYCFDWGYPAAEDGFYQKDKVYTLTLRTLLPELAQYFLEKLPLHTDANMKGLTAEIRELPKKKIDVIYTLTPAILKSEGGYWRDNMSIEEFEERLKNNLIKKWNDFTQMKLEEDFEFYTLIEFVTLKPMAVPYKNIILLGDKFKLHIADNEKAQNLAYFCLGAGILEMNARGAGFCNFRWV